MKWLRLIVAFSNFLAVIFFGLSVYANIPYLDTIMMFFYGLSIALLFDSEFDSESRKTE